MDDAMTDFLDTPGCRLAYADHGTGTPVLLSHGAGADRRMFDAQVPFLVDHGFRAITWDLRLHGESRPSSEPVTPARLVADLLALLAHLRIERAVLVGQSLGGNLSQAVVRRHPELALGLGVIGSAWNTGPLSRLERTLVSSAAPALRLVPAQRLPRFMAEASAVTAGGRAYAEGVFGAIPKPDFIDVWRATVGFLEPDAAYRTPVPLLLLRGAADRTGNIATAMPRWAAAEGVQELVVPDAGHLANVDAPDAVNAALLAWLRTIPAD
jgi:pimeloyl-ACP methyl ester carboxylesterase